MLRRVQEQAELGPGSRTHFWDESSNRMSVQEGQRRPGAQKSPVSEFRGGGGEFPEKGQP